MDAELARLYGVPGNPWHSSGSGQLNWRLEFRAMAGELENIRGVGIINHRITFLFANDSPSLRGMKHRIVLAARRVLQSPEPRAAHFRVVRQ